MTSPGPTDLARLLRDAIAAAQDRDPAITKAGIGRVVGMSKSTITHYTSVDKTTVAAKPDMVRRIMAAIGADEATTDDAVRLAEDLDAPRVVLLRSSSFTMQSRLLAMEQRTEHVRVFSPVLVPGLLQTAKYMRGIFTAAGQPSSVVERNVAGRLARQAALDDAGRRYTLLCTVGGLMWHAVSALGMAEQVGAVARAARHDSDGRVRVGIIDRAVPADIFPLTGFDLYDEREVVVGTLTGTAFLDWPGDVQRYVAQFDQLAAMAVWGEDAAAVADRIVEDYCSL